MLLQSQGGVLHLLPALPSAWPTGSVRGLRGRGGITVSIFWRDGRLSSAVVKADQETDLTIRYRSRSVRVYLRRRTEHPIPVAMFREPEAG
jgi:alpha-L-fucosidase 2